MARFRLTVPLRAAPFTELAGLSVLLHDVAEHTRVGDDRRLVAEDGRTVPDLELDAGDHLRPGARYLAPDPATGEDADFTVRAWERHRQTAIDFTVGEFTGEFRLTAADDPQLLTVDGAVPPPEAGRFRRLRTLTASLRLDLDAWFRADGTTGATARLDHPLARAAVEFAPDIPGGRGEESWQTRVTVTVGGRGVLRPFLAVPLLVLRPLLRPHVDRAVRQAAEEWNSHYQPWLLLPEARQRQEILDELCAIPDDPEHTTSPGADPGGDGPGAYARDT
ncbi:hypothetical protein [Streptomyces sp. SM14]|uniref:hypothetical protein n=1 Tax=Streptomyces sp. SM14 TaxID=1736045 RepID=UPI000CD50888|nr:hypothetical protein [Streptomyces sp. SM14]